MQAGRQVVSDRDLNADLDLLEEFRGQTAFHIFNSGTKVVRSVSQWSPAIRIVRLKTQSIDWSKCEDVESVPGRLSGAWVLKGTRVPAQAIVDNAEDGYTAEQIATEIFDNLPLEHVKGVLRFAKRAMMSGG